MAINLPAELGRDVRCMLDADELWTEAEGIDVVRQDAFHRLTTDDVLGDDGTGSLLIVGWGFDVRRLLGVPVGRLPAYQPILVEVLLRDPRIDQATVRLEPTVTNGLADILLHVECTTAQGPFSLIRRISDLSAADLVAQS
jgi:hypothetical protein